MTKRQHGEDERLNRRDIPGLKRIGVQDQAIRTMSVDAPKRFFDGA